MSDDRFGGDQDERTVIRPTPGRRPAPDATIAAPPPAAMPASNGRSPQSEADAKQALSAAGTNAIVAAASPILALCVRLRSSASHPDVPGLRQRMIGEIRTFEERVFQLGLNQETLRTLRYVICATVDDIVLSTPWGVNSIWSQSTMVSTFHKETFSGERFFDLLDKLQRDPAHNLDVLELMYLCLSLGFEGRYRIHPRGALELSRIRDGLYRLIRQHRGDFERELSPHWRGLDAGRKSLAGFVPLWVIAVVTAALLAMIYAGLSYLLNNRSDQLYASLDGLRPSGAIVLARASPAPPPPPPPAADPGQVNRITGFLESEIKEGLVTVFEDAQSVTVRIINKGKGIFASGSAELEPRYVTVVERVATALREETGPIQVVGHSDNVPIRTIRFPSNFHLSQERARSVAEMVKKRLDDPGRVTAEARADAEPIASNATADGREQNRRIELVLMKTAGKT